MPCAVYDLTSAARLPAGSLRILPHHQNTGGFFLAVLEKVAPMPREASTPEDPPPSSPAEEQSAAPPPKKRPRRMRGYNEDPYFFAKKGDAMVEELE